VERFLERHKDRIVGVLSGFDRVLFRGTIRSLSHLTGFDMFLSSQGILYKDYKAFVQRNSARLKEHAKAIAAERQRLYLHVASAKQSKDELAQKIMARDGIRQGLVCVLSCVEPCQTFSVRKNQDKGKLELVSEHRKCLHLYFYFVDRDFGLMHVRLQTWAPYPIQVCLNGREYLARQMRRAGIGFQQHDNCFTQIDDLPKAQALLDRLHQRQWARFLNALARRANPLLAAKADPRLRDYYWSLRQVEYATDVLFRDAAHLQELYPHLVLHGIQQFRADEVLRFLGRHSNRRFAGEVTSEIKHRPEGVCLKHWVEENSIKMYDKHGSVLRIETTINNPRRFRVRRWATRKGQRQLCWVPMRKGLADIPRRVAISRAANQRYLQALAVVGQPQPVAGVLDPVSRRIMRDGRPYRALRPVTAEEARVFAVILGGAFVIQGFRNRDLHPALAPEAPLDRNGQRKASGRVTRCLRLLRAHGLIAKVGKARYYRVTPRGQNVMTTALKLRRMDFAQLAA
jgi:hypothetical protein